MACSRRGRRAWIDGAAFRQSGIRAPAGAGLDTFTLAHGGDHATAFWNVAGQMSLGLGAVYLGFNLGL